MVTVIQMLSNRLMTARTVTVLQISLTRVMMDLVEAAEDSAAAMKVAVGEGVVGGGVEEIWVIRGSLPLNLYFDTGVKLPRPCLDNTRHFNAASYAVISLWVFTSHASPS